jgi:hypothetical protein
MDAFFMLRNEHEVLYVLKNCLYGRKTTKKSKKENMELLLPSQKILFRIVYGKK